MTRRFGVVLVGCVVSAALSRSPGQPDWRPAEAQLLQHYSDLIRLDTTATERRAAEYVKDTLAAHGITAVIYAMDQEHPNVIARLKGSGKKRPLLIMGHTDTVAVDQSKWTLGAFSASRHDGAIYGRGTIDDKDTVAVGMMILMLLKQYAVPLDRDVILLAASGEESASPAGVRYMLAEHRGDIDAEYCLAEGGDIIRERAVVKYAEVETTEKISNGIELVARGVSGHGSIPLPSNAIVHLAGAVARIGAWRPTIALNETTAAYFRRLSSIAAPEQARYYADVVSGNPAAVQAADDWFFVHEPRHSSMLRTSVSPNIFVGGYKSNVIPSEATVRLDVRMLPDEDPPAFLDALKRVVDDPAIDVHFANPQRERPKPAVARLDSELFKAVESAVARVYQAPAVPSMSTGATDMAPVRMTGTQCVGIGPAIDVEDQAKGFGMHGDQERLLESELYRFLHLMWEVVNELSRAA